MHSKPCTSNTHGAQLTRACQTDPWTLVSCTEDADSVAEEVTETTAPSEDYTDDMEGNDIVTNKSEITNSTAVHVLVVVCVCLFIKYSNQSHWTIVLHFLLK